MEKKDALATIALLGSLTVSLYLFVDSSVPISKIFFPEPKSVGFLKHAITGKGDDYHLFSNRKVAIATFITTSSLFLWDWVTEKN